MSAHPNLTRSGPGQIVVMMGPVPRCRPRLHRSVPAWAEIGRVGNFSPEEVSTQSSKLPRVPLVKVKFKSPDGEQGGSTAPPRWRGTGGSRLSRTTRLPRDLTHRRAVEHAPIFAGELGT
jgi:hypothetical protein